PNKFLIPLAVLVAGGLIVWGLWSARAERKLSREADTNDATETILSTEQEQEKIKTELDITSSDYILGNPDAEIMLIEFIDLECPYCVDFYKTTQKIIVEYGRTGEVALIFRHFPASGEVAFKEAVATECAGKLGGNGKFWEYLDAFFALKEQQSQIELEQIAENLGLNMVGFSACLENDAIKSKIKTEFEGGLAIGIQSTPQTILLLKNGKIFPINGAQSYRVVKAILNLILSEQGSELLE
ncbi:MAG: DsbA family protein, partial [Proteobacteria bacterium]|nr:DsbA family protein [Pseudomonadota bacterium]